MANYANLKADIQAVIKQNGNQEITGNLLQQSLIAMINSLGNGYLYKGIATPSTNPGSPDQNIFYIASTAGTYVNMGGLTLGDGEVAVIKYNGSWSKDITGIASQSVVSQLGQEVAKISGGNLQATISIDKIINAGGNWNNAGSTNYAKLIDAKDVAGQTLYVAPNETNNAIIAFLASASTTSTAPQYCISENNRRVVLMGNTESFVIPVDCKYIYVVVWNNSADAHPTLTVGSVESQLVSDVRNLNQRTSDNIIQSVSWFQNDISNSAGYITNSVTAIRLRSYMLVKGGSKLYYNLSGLYKIAFTLWDGSTLPIPSSTGWLTDTGIIDVPSNCIVIITVADIRDISISSDILTDTDVIVRLWTSDMADIAAMKEPTPKFIQAAVTDTITPNFNITSRVSNSSVYLHLPVGSGFFYKLADSYKIGIIDFNDSKTIITSTSWLPENTGYWKVKNGNIVFSVKKTGDTTITPAEVEANLKLIFYKEDLYNVLLDAAERQFANIADGFFPIVWKQGTISDSGGTIGTIISAGNRLCDLVNIEEYASGSIWYFINDGYRAYFSGWNGVANPMPASTGWLYGSGKFDIPDGSRYVRFGAALISNAVLHPEDGENIKLFTNELDWELYVQQQLVSNKVLRPYYYYGEKVVLEHRFNVEQYKIFSDWHNMQGGAIYGDNLVCLMAADEIPTATVNGFIYNVATGEKVCDLLFGSTLGGKTYELPHANQVSFGTQFYNANSRFPLLYVSQVNGGSATLWNNSERGVLVYDLQTEDDGETFTPVLVQAIIPDLTTIDPETGKPLIENFIGKYTPNYIVDTDKNQLVILGYPNESWYNLTGQQPVAIIDVPSINEGTEIVFDSTDIIDSYKFPVSTGIQQSFYKDGMIYSLGGTAAHGSLRVIDLSKKAVVTTIELDQWTSGEPQFAGYWNHKFLYYNAGTTGEVFEMIF